MAVGQPAERSSRVMTRLSREYLSDFDKEIKNRKQLGLFDEGKEDEAK